MASSCEFRKWNGERFSIKLGKCLSFLLLPISLSCSGVVLVLSTVSSCNAGAPPAEPGFEVRGQIKWEILTVHPKEWTFDFSAKVIDPAWEIRVRPSADSTYRDFKLDEIVATCDGQTLYVIKNFETDQEKRRGRGEQVGPNASESLVYRNIVPNNEAFLAPIWLAFCSRAYFRDLRTNLITVPICENVFSGMSINSIAALEYRQAAFWSFADEPPFCPRTLYSVDDGSIKGVRGELYTITKDHYAPPYDSGFTNIAFEASDYSKVNGFKLAKSASLDVYCLRGTPQVMTHLHQLQVTVASMKSTHAAIDFPPRIAGIAVVCDWRFALSNRPMQVAYLATNRYLSVQEVTANTAQLNQALQTWRLIGAQGGLRVVQAPNTKWWRAAFVSIGAVLAVCLWIRAVKTKQNQ